MSLCHTLRRLCLAAVASSALLAGAAHAGLYTNSFGALVPGYVANDDHTYTVTLPFSFTFFGTSYTSAVVSNNGNIQFGSDSTAYSSSPLNTQTDFRGIAAFWSDLESRSDPLGAIAAGTGGSGVYMNVVNANQVVFTWDRLGYYDRDYASRVQFQLVLNNPAALQSGQGTIGFFYGDMTGQSGSRQAAIGFGDGQWAINDGEVSLSAGLSTAVAAYANRTGSVWFNVTDNGTPQETELPEPASLALVTLALGALGLARRRTRR
ncbi:MAG: PEP-CTERM sorting domain-containing protein [Comamonadaceae bacterium]|jgi:hypothetical protein|nr:PEP-CTERM sorting domain-containing protein [Comamonadaceae bacterium]